MPSRGTKKRKSKTKDHTKWEKERNKAGQDGMDIVKPLEVEEVEDLEALVDSDEGAVQPMEIDKNHHSALKTKPVIVKRTEKVKRNKKEKMARAVSEKMAARLEKKSSKQNKRNALLH